MKAVFFMVSLALPFSLAAADDQTRLPILATHTSTPPFLADAGMAGTKVGPNDAYRFVLGETVTSSTGQAKRRSQEPLDFVVIADHAENLGLADAIASADPGLLSDPFGKELYDLVMAGKGVDAFNALVQKMAKGAEAKIKERIHVAQRVDQNHGAGRPLQRPGRIHRLYWLRVDLATRR